MESDWKKFSACLPTWRERYLAKRNAHLIRLLSDTQKTETERFWEVEGMVLRDAKTLRRCFDDLSRSKMWLRLMDMRKARVIEREDLADFSEDLQRQVFDDPF